MDQSHRICEDIQANRGIIPLLQQQRHHQVVVEFAVAVDGFLQATLDGEAELLVRVNGWSVACRALQLTPEIQAYPRSVR